MWIRHTELDASLTADDGDGLGPTHEESCGLDGGIPKGPDGEAGV